MKLNAPSKTFFIGEYAVLAGYPALVATTPPYFELVIDEASDPELLNIHPNSPAGKLWAEHPDKKGRLTFCDPHEGRGGYGASSAQFLMVYQWLHQIFEWDHEKLFTLLACYKQYAGSKPSGADLLSQAVGGFVIVNPEKKEIESTTWPFDSIAWQLQHTGHKCSTHQHLDALTQDDFTQLGKLAETGIAAYRAKDASQFFTLINQYYDALLQLNLVHDTTQFIIEECRQQPTLLAAKGCGAMGADVVLTLSELPK